MDVNIEVLESIKARLKKINLNNINIDESGHGHNQTPLGLCGISHDVYNEENMFLDFKQIRKFREILERRAKSQKQFWLFSCETTDSDDQFMWHPYDFQSRLKFMNLLIDLAK